MYVLELMQNFHSTLQLFIRPPAQLTRLAGELILDIFIIFTGRADPTAANLPLPNDLEALGGIIIVKQ